jgi:hypothetical protein
MTDEKREGGPTSIGSHSDVEHDKALFIVLYLLIAIGFGAILACFSQDAVMAFETILAGIFYEIMGGNK